MTRGEWAVIALLWAVAAAMSAGLAAAAPALMPSGAWLDAPATTVAERVSVNFQWTLALLLPFVFGPVLMLGFAVWKFRARNNISPRAPRDSMLLEGAWTLAPALVLVAVGTPSVQLLSWIDRAPEPDMIVEVTGHQFFWQYHYAEEGIDLVDDGTGGEALVLPVGKTIALHGTSTQVNHAWWVPAFAVKFDVVPGRISQGWFVPTRTGEFTGQCAELCGELHARMLIHVRVVTEDEYRAWVSERAAAGAAL